MVLVFLSAISLPLSLDWSVRVHSLPHTTPAISSYGFPHLPALFLRFLTLFPHFLRTASSHYFRTFLALPRTFPAVSAHGFPTLFPYVPCASPHFSRSFLALALANKVFWLESKKDIVWIPAHKRRVTVIVEKTDSQTGKRQTNLLRNWMWPNSFTLMQTQQ